MATGNRREELILSLTKKVESIAGVFCKRCVVSRDDLIQVGWLGAIAAVDAFDESKGCSLETYAAYKIDGAIRDHLRVVSLVRLPKKVAQKVRREQQESQDRALAYDEKLPGYFSFCCFDTHTARFFPDSYSFDNLIDKITIEKLIAVSKLTPKERTVVLMNLTDLNLREIGTKLGFNESRASQLRASALSKMYWIFYGQDKIPKNTNTSDV